MNQPSANQNEGLPPKKINLKEETEMTSSKLQGLDKPQDADESEEDQTLEGNYLLARDRTRREIKAPQRYGYVDLITFALVIASEVVEEDPKSVDVSLARQEGQKWLKVMEE